MARYICNGWDRCGLKDFSGVCLVNFNFVYFALFHLVLSYYNYLISLSKTPSRGSKGEDTCNREDGLIKNLGQVLIWLIS